MKKCYMFAILFLAVMMSSCSVPSDLQDFEMVPNVTNVTAYTHVSIREINAKYDSSSSSQPELNMWNVKKSSPHVRENAPLHETVIFQEDEYTGEYTYSCVDLYNNHISDYYQYSHGFFAVHSENRSLETFVEFNEKIGSLSADDCYQKAVKIVSQYIDLSDYTMSVRSDQYTHSFLFQKYIDQVATCSKLSIGYNTQGNLVSFQRMMISEMDSSVEAIGEDNLHILVDMLTSEDARQSLAQSFEHDHEKWSQYVINDPLLVILENGSFGMLYTISYEKRYVNSDGTIDLWDDVATYILTCD